MFGIQNLIFEDLHISEICKEKIKNDILYNRV